MFGDASIKTWIDRHATFFFTSRSEGGQCETASAGKELTKKIENDIIHTQKFGGGLSPQFVSVTNPRAKSRRNYEHNQEDHLVAILAAATGVALVE